MRKLITALVFSLFVAPLAAQNVSSSKGDWNNIPELSKNRIVELNSDPQNMAETVASQGKCKAVGNTDRVKLALQFLVEFGTE